MFKLRSSLIGAQRMLVQSNGPWTPSSECTGVMKSLMYLVYLVYLLSPCLMCRQKDLVAKLQAQGSIQSPEVAGVMERVDRGDFCPTQAYEDHPVGIGFGATISAPHMHAYALERALPYLKPGARVLDVGCGSGYLSVCFARLVKPNGLVVGVEHVEGLRLLSEINTKKHSVDLMRSGVLKYVLGDGRLGWPSSAPYDVIHVGAMAEGGIPPVLIEQLRPGGILIIPAEGYMTIVRKDNLGRTSKTKEMAVRYVPLTDASRQVQKSI